MPTLALNSAGYAPDIEPQGYREPERYMYYRAAQSLTIDGKLDEPHLWVTVTERDVPVLVDHDFEVIIDPDGDAHG